MRIEAAGAPLVAPDAWLAERGLIDPDAQLQQTAADLLAAAVDVVETSARRFLSPRRVTFEEVGAGLSVWNLPAGPVAAIEAVEIWNGSGWDPVAGAVGWRLYNEPSIVFPDAVPAGALVQAVCQCGDADPPLTLVQAVKLLAGEWLDAGAIDRGPDGPRLSFGVRNLIRLDRFERVGVWS